jgi:hypothetical protein
MTGMGAALRGMRGDLHAAADQQLTKVVAMLDGLTNRGEADALIAVLRPRLARLRPPRPLNFHRIMFIPFDPLIVAGTDWSRDAPGVPRTILRPLGDMVRRSSPDQIAVIDRLLAEPEHDNLATTLRVGKILWPLATETLLSAVVPRDWQATTGLRDADFQPLCHSIGSILRHVPALVDIVVADTAGVPLLPDDIAQFMARFADADPRTTAMLLAILNLRLPHVAEIRDLNQTLCNEMGAPRLRLAANQAHEFILHKLETAPPPSANLAQAEAEVTRLAAVIDTQSHRFRDRPVQLARIEAARTRLDAFCRNRFVDLLAEQVLAPIDRIAGADDSTIDGFEQDARALRRFDLVARKLGGGPSYDLALRASAEKLRPRADDSATTRIDKLRLAEILLGSAAAAGMA